MTSASTTPVAEWTFSDAWVACAIAVAAAPPSLGNVIAAADGINHAILTRAEFEQAVGRLVDAGLLLEPSAPPDPPAFHLSHAGVALLSRRNGSLFTQVNNAHRLLTGAPCPNPRPWHISQELWEAAVAAYVKRTASQGD